MLCLTYDLRVANHTPFSVVCYLKPLRHSESRVGGKNDFYMRSIISNPLSFLYKEVLNELSKVWMHFNNPET